MSEVHEEADEANVNEQASGGETPEWLVGDPDPQRLVSYADNLRTERTKLKERLEAAERAWEDEEEWVKRGAERFPDRFVQDSEETDDDDELEDDDDDPRDHKLSELEANQRKHDEWIAQQEQQASLRAFNTDLDELAASREVELDDDDRALILERSVKIGAESKAWDRKATEQALDWLVKKYEKREQAALERVKSSKRAPHVPTGGTAGKGPQPDLDTPAGRKAYYAQRLGQGA